MKTFDYIVTDEMGIHARPASYIVKEAKKYASKIVLEYDGKSVEAVRLMAIMELEVKQGHKVTVVADGLDEELAITAMEKLMQENL